MTCGSKVSLHLSTDEGATYGEKIADIVQLDPPEATADTFDDKHYGSEDCSKDFGVGAVDEGELNITARYKPGQTELEAIEAALRSHEVLYLRLVFPDPINKQMSFKGVVTKVGHAIPKEARIDRMFTVKLTGAAVKSDVA